MLLFSFAYIEDMDELIEDKTPLLSQEGWREAPGDSRAETLRLWNHSSRDPLRDPAALLTQEGSFPFSIILDLLNSSTLFFFHFNFESLNFDHTHRSPLRNRQSR